VSRAAIVVLVVVLVLGGLFLLLRPDTQEGGPQDRTFDVSIKDGEMSPEEISVNQDDTVTLRVRTDEPTELHVHGYDVEQEVEPGREAEIGFEADLTGRFEMEDHESEKELGVLQVRPR
jgi:heme/copper-type cytochrome/quinol oxidase subunit 2